MYAPEWMQNAAELSSLWLTFPTVILGVAVVALWGPHIVKQVATRKDLDSHDWLILGVFVAFLGAVIDNCFWGIAWTLDYLESDYRDWWFRHGVYPNVFARQIAGSYAAYCHLVAFYQTAGQRRVNHWVALTLAVGFLYACMLGILKKLLG